MQRLNAKEISEQDRFEVFLHFSNHFIDDISGERLATTLHKIGNAQAIINDFDSRLRKSCHPRASILLRKTTTELTENYGLPPTEGAPLNLTWSDTLEEEFRTSKAGATIRLVSPLDLLKSPYQFWKLIFRSKQASLIGSRLRKHYLNRLSSPQTPDDIWLKTFETYSTLFNTPTDILIMAENLKSRHPARDLALLDFTYRVRYKKAKVLLFHRRTRLALADTLKQDLPDYRGTQLTQIFFNPLEEVRQKKRDALVKKRAERNQRLKAEAKARAKKREEERKKLVDASVKRGQKRQRDRKKLVDKSVKRRNKILKTRAKKRQSRKKRRASKISKYFSAVTLPVKVIVFRLLRIKMMDEDSPVQLILKSAESTEQSFEYISADHKALRDDPSVAIFSITGRLDPLLDISILANFSKIIILNATGLKDDILMETIKELLGIDIELDCFSPAKLLIRPYTNDHKIISDFSDGLAYKLTSHLSAHRALSTYFEQDLSEEYALTLSDNVFRYIERFYAANLFFKTIDKNTPVFFNSVQDNFPLTLAKIGFSNIVVFGGTRLLGKTRSTSPVSRHVHPKVWAPKLRETFKALNNDIKENISKTHKPKNKSVLIVTHSRSSLHKASAAMLQSDLSHAYETQMLDLAPQASSTKDKQNLYQITHRTDLKLNANLKIALLPVVTRALSDLSLHDYDVQDMMQDIAIIVARNTRHLIGHTALYRAVKAEYKGHNKAAAILVPGRYAEIRAIARAFHALGLPTIDLQLLFLSTMARYRPPIATHNAVIDTVTRDFYQQNYGIDSKNVNVIGSIMRDDDIKRAKELGRAAALQQLGFNPHARVITLACQPGFETASCEAAKLLGQYLADNSKISLVIKLHPAQGKDHKTNLTTILEEFSSPDTAQRWRVVHKEPFWSVIPATTILMSYFSNVCLQACAFGIPVLSLPGGGTRPDPDFETIGLARNVTELTNLPTQLDYILGLTKAAQRREPPFAYIEQNPHMAGHDALGNLQVILDKLVESQTT